MEDKDLLKKDGFRGFYSVKELNEFKEIRQLSSKVPATKGVYVVLRVSNTNPCFLEKGAGGSYRGKDPNVSIAELERNWIDGTSIVYIGKATKLKNRISSYLRFCNTQAASHWGGRYIWQLADSSNLIICWKEVSENPRKVEEKMIQDFKKEHGGQRPFANLND